MKMKLTETFWAWYERNYTLNVGLAAGLFVLQLVHLYWLTADVVLLRLIGKSIFELNTFWETAITLVDYTEIPAIITTSLVYIHQLRLSWNRKSIAYLFFLNSQWLHIFWITDEVVIAQFTGQAAIILPLWLSWLAISIDYLELPVIYDTLKRFILSLTKKTNE